jgi:hypothetical protein
MIAIRASHLDGEIESDLRQARVNRLIAVERARDVARGAVPQPAPSGAAPAPPKPKPEVKPPPKTSPAPPKFRPRPDRPRPGIKADPQQPVDTAPPPPPQGSVPVLPPGSMIMSASELEIIDRLMESHPATAHLFPRKDPMASRGEVGKTATAKSLTSRERF